MRQTPLVSALSYNVQYYCITFVVVCLLCCFSNIAMYAFVKKNMYPESSSMVLA